ncbi:MAG: hypothetical protein WBN30_09830 [Polyangiales bacterium]
MQRNAFINNCTFLIAVALALVASPALAQSEVVAVSPSEIEMMPAATAEAQLAERAKGTRWSVSV